MGRERRDTVKTGEWVPFNLSPHAAPTGSFLWFHPPLPAGGLLPPGESSGSSPSYKTRYPSKSDSTTGSGPCRPSIRIVMVSQGLGPPRTHVEPRPRGGSRWTLASPVPTVCRPPCLSRIIFPGVVQTGLQRRPMRTPCPRSPKPMRTAVSPCCGPGPTSWEEGWPHSVSRNTDCSRFYEHGVFSDSDTRCTRSFRRLSAQDRTGVARSRGGPHCSPDRHPCAAAPGALMGTRRQLPGARRTGTQMPVKR